jgi:hypothetical protein
MVIGVFALSGQAAYADSGGATISVLPESETLQASVELHHECSSTENCFWFGEASSYWAAVECPSTFDESHYAWSGPVDTLGTSFGTFSFNPYGPPNEIKLCLYVHAEEDHLVGESHPFNRRAGSEVLPPPPQLPKRYSTKTTVSVSTRGCEFWPHVAVDGKKNIGGDITWVLYSLDHRQWQRENAHTQELAIPFNATEAAFGTYRFQARFLGDENLLASSHPAFAVFRITNRSC